LFLCGPQQDGSQIPYNQSCERQEQHPEENGGELNGQKLIDLGESAIVVLIFILGILTIIETMLRILEDFGYLLLLAVSLFIVGAVSIVMGAWLQREV
jgi:hypothetical protein